MDIGSSSAQTKIDRIDNSVKQNLFFNDINYFTSNDNETKNNLSNDPNNNQGFGNNFTSSFLKDGGFPTSSKHSLSKALPESFNYNNNNNNNSPNFFQQVQENFQIMQPSQLNRKQYESKSLINNDKNYTPLGKFSPYKHKNNEIIYDEKKQINSHLSEEDSSLDQVLRFKTFDSGAQINNNNFHESGINNCDFYT